MNFVKKDIQNPVLNDDHYIKYEGGDESIFQKKETKIGGGIVALLGIVATVFAMKGGKCGGLGTYTAGDDANLATCECFEGSTLTEVEGVDEGTCVADVPAEEPAPAEETAPVEPAPAEDAGGDTEGADAGATLYQDHKRSSLFLY